jgi:hypothetical protein
LYRKGSDSLELLASLDGDLHIHILPLLEPHAKEAERIVAARGLSTARPALWPDD